MQSQMITILHIMSGGGTANYEDLLGISEDSRIRAVSALKEQFQRMVTVAPLARGLLRTFSRDLPTTEPSTKASSIEAMGPAHPTRLPLARRLPHNGIRRHMNSKGRNKTEKRGKQKKVEKNGFTSGAT